MLREQKPEAGRRGWRRIGGFERWFILAFYIHPNADEKLTVMFSVQDAEEQVFVSGLSGENALKIEEV
jgi:hypothetical protein